MLRKLLDPAVLCAVSYIYIYIADWSMSNVEVQTADVEVGPS